MFNDEKIEMLENKIEVLENLVGKFEEENKSEKPDDYLSSLTFSLIYDWWDSKPKTLIQKHKSLQKEHDQLVTDFKELDHKFDLLERFLQVEYFKIDEKTATYDWANKTSNEGFRKIKQTYEEMKEEKNKPVCTPCDCDD